MNNILTITDKDFNPGAILKPEDEYSLRRAARAVLLNDSGEMLLMNVSKYGYHKLPGGGIEDGENIAAALLRELIEELGCNAEIIREIGQITELRSIYNYQKQISYCYLAKQIGEQQETSLDPGEIEAGMHEVKAKSIGVAIKLLENDQPANLEGQFIQVRDLAFLKEALNFI